MTQGTKSLLDKSWLVELAKWTWLLSFLHTLPRRILAWSFVVITPHNMIIVSILFVCTATHVPWRRVQKAYWVGIAKSFADFCTCFSLVKSLLSGSHSHPPKDLIYLKEGDNCQVTDFCTCFRTWKCDPVSKWIFVKLHCIHMCRDAGYKKLIEWGLPSHLLIFAPASAWSLLHITCLSPSSLSALLHMCRDALVGQKLRLLSFPQWTWLVSSSAHPFPVES